MNQFIKQEVTLVQQLVKWIYFSVLSDVFLSCSIIVSLSRVFVFHTHTLTDAGVCVFVFVLKHCVCVFSAIWDDNTLLSCHVDVIALMQ